MSPRALGGLAALIFLAGLGLALRHDLALHYWRQGHLRLRAGDGRGALEALSRAGNCAPGSLPVAFDTGVALYRLGELSRARSLFARASRAADPGLRGAALYNLGNCAYLLAERGAGGAAPGSEAGKGEGGGGSGSRELLEEAARRYGEALAVAPEAADARHNLEVVRARLAEGALRDRRAGAAGAPRKGGGGPAKERAGGERGKSGSQGEAAGPGAKAPGGQPGGAEQRGAGSSDGRPGAASAAGKAPPQLTRDAAERMLNQARGRESGGLPLQGGRGKLARPERDW